MDTTKSKIEIVFTYNIPENVKELKKIFKGIYEDNEIDLISERGGDYYIKYENIHNIIIGWIEENYGYDNRDCFAKEHIDEMLKILHSKDITIDFLSCEEFYTSIAIATFEIYLNNIIDKKNSK